MRWKKYILSGFIICLLFVMGRAQNFTPESPGPIPPIRTCATMEQDSLLRLKFPEMGTLDEFEIAVQHKLAEMDRRQAAGRFEAVLITIPIIFHVIHNGEPIGEGTNISTEQVQAQIDVLNEDFRRLAGTNGFNSHVDGADIEVEFCLATVDPSGNAMNEAGINRIQGTKQAWTREAIEGELKPLTIWNANYYYNVWTLKFDTKDQLLLGYAQFPSESGLNGLPISGGPASTDGVVLKYSVVGSAQKGSFPVMQAPYNLGRTLVHETGHWLGLRHIWGDGPCNADDFCDDTPLAAGPNRGCPTGAASCNSLDMIQNYMDYTDDACMNIFTKNQKARILAVLELSPRRGILQNSTVCGQIVADTPIANFTADKTDILLGGTVKFTDLSSNFPKTWAWSFEGGEPTVSVDRNPTVTYNQSGTYKVSLIAGNDIGVDTLEFLNYINVSDQGLCNSLSNFSGGTPSLLRPATGETGFIAGHNSLQHKAKSEFFNNGQGYVELSGARVRFGFALGASEDATAKIVVWNALGPQNAPARVLEEKEVLIKQIQADIAANRPTEVFFDRRVPVFLGTSFHVGIELTYNGDSLALITTQDGQATTQTSWEQDAEGIWSPYSLSWGLDVAHDITPVVGMKPSVHIAPSDLVVYPGHEVTLNASGASIFQWNSDDGEINDALGPQIRVHPRTTTTYTLTGSGIDLCDDQVALTIYVKTPPLGTEILSGEDIKLFPNPAGQELNFILENNKRGVLNVMMYNSLGQLALEHTFYKQMETFSHRFNLQGFNPGVYVLVVDMDGYIVRKKVMVR